MRFAIVGCGVIGKQHVRTIGTVADAELACVVDIEPERAAAFAHDYGIPGLTDLDKALARDDIDAVAVCTPSGRHADIAVPALAAGKHVIVEKPLEITPDAAERIADAAWRTGKTVTVISQRRFAPINRFMRTAIERGDLGHITSGSAAMYWWRSPGYYASAGWRGTWSLDGGGALMNQGIHTIDLLTWLMGKPVEVTAYAATVAHPDLEVEDTAIAAVRYETGALASIHGTTAAFPGTISTVGIFGDRGSMQTTNDRLEYFYSAPAQEAAAAAYGGGGGNQADEVREREGLDGEAQETPTADSVKQPAKRTGHSAQYEDFIDAVTTGREPFVTVADNTRTLGVIWGIYESARTGMPVRIG
ncbi:MAG: Gfo/Idh/MocA family protein [Mycobacteriales bacterium]